MLLLSEHYNYYSVIQLFILFIYNYNTDAVESSVELSEEKNEGKRISEVAQELHGEGILKESQHEMQEMLSSIQTGITLLHQT